MPAFVTHATRRFIIRSTPRSHPRSHSRSLARAMAVSVACLGLGLLPLAPRALPAQPAPTSGVQVLERMRRAYDGVWYPTLTFVQKTVMHRPDGNVAEQTWHESVLYTPEHGSRLRIDIGDMSANNGMLYTSDSTWIVRGGKQVATRGEGNPFLPLIESVYMQPVERTVRELQPTRVDLSQVRAGQWRDRPVWIVGATAVTDTVSPQFWVDAGRNVVVRMILGDTPAQRMDVHLDGYQPVGKAWLGTDVRIHVGGRLVQEERYSDWKTGVPLDASLFDLARWATAPHWAR